MTQHKRSAAAKHSAGRRPESSDRRLHKDWRVWLAIGIMLTAIITYVLTLDDSVVPMFMRQ